MSPTMPVADREWRDRAEKAEAEVERLRQVLQWVEWDHAECRACDGHQHQGGHDAGCPVAAALRSTSAQPASGGKEDP